MRVDCIGKNKIKIILTEEEVLRHFGGYDMIDYSSPRSKATLNAILTSALPDEMLPLDCNRVLIEIQAENKGCVIYFTKVYKKQKNTQLKKSNQKTLALAFLNSEDLISFICNRLNSNIISSEIYHISTKYILTIKFYEAHSPDTLYLKEFCNQLITDECALAHIQEHGKLICADTQTIKSSFKTP